MKNYLTKLSILTLAMMPVSALAIGELTLASGSVINVAGINLTVAGSPMDSIVVGANSFDVVISNNQSVTITSTDKRTMGFSSASAFNAPLVCNTSDSVYTLTNPSSGATITVTVTPSTSVCTSGTGGGSGGGGGAGGGGGSAGAPGPAASVAPATPAVSATPAIPTVAPAVPATPATPSAARAAILEGFSQKLAVIAQAVAGLSADTPAAVIASLRQQLGVLAAALQSLQSTTATSAPVKVGLITKQIFLGDRNDLVRSVQQAFASDPEIYTGLVTGYFGPGTKGAIQKFQVKYGIAAPGGLGYGVFGPKTMKKFNEVFGK